MALMYVHYGQKMIKKVTGSTKINFRTSEVRFEFSYNVTSGQTYLIGPRANSILFFKIYNVTY